MCCASNLFFNVAKLVISDTLIGCQHRGLSSLYRSAAVEGYAETLCSTLDNSDFLVLLFNNCSSCHFTVTLSIVEGHSLIVSLFRWDFLYSCTSEPGFDWKWTSCSPSAILEPLVTSPPRGVQSIVMSISVCLSVCLYVHRHNSKTAQPQPSFTKFFVHVACGHVSILLWWFCDMLCISSFMDDVMFSYCGATGQNQARHYV